MKYHVIKSQFLHLYFSRSVCLRRKRNIMIASSLQGLLICYGESLSGTLRTIECQKMSEVQKEKESISRYLSFKPIPPMTVSPHALETTNSRNSIGILWGSCTALGWGSLSRVNPEFWTGSSQKGKCLFADSQNGLILLELTPHRDGVLSFLIPTCFDETLMVDPPCLVRAAMARKALSAICFFWQWVLCRVSLLETPPPRCVALGSCWMPLLHFWWPVGVCNPNFKFIKVLAVLVYETMDLDVAKT